MCRGNGEHRGAKLGERALTAGYGIGIAIVNPSTNPGSTDCRGYGAAGGFGRNLQGQ
jgi:hypothetical protein